MSGLLLDTNVVSESTQPEPNSNVLAFLASETNCWLSSMVIHELEYGIRRMPYGRRRDQVAAVIRALIDETAHRILPIGLPEAVHAAEFRARLRRSGRTLSISDSFIAATGAVHNLALVTRNTTDFEGLDLRLINPWE